MPYPLAQSPAHTIPRTQVASPPHGIRLHRHLRSRMNCSMACLISFRDGFLSLIQDSHGGGGLVAVTEGKETSVWYAQRRGLAQSYWNDLMFGSQSKKTGGRRPNRVVFLSLHLVPYSRNHDNQRPSAAGSCWL
jgi:hypothetical protein